jgi:hypothetical protein
MLKALVGVALVASSCGAPVARTYGPGYYHVGRDILPGYYTTSGRVCEYSVQRADGRMVNFAVHGRYTIRIYRQDVEIAFHGNCHWRLA